MKKHILALALLATVTVSYAEDLIKEMQSLKLFKDYNVTVNEVKKVSKDWYTIKAEQPTRAGVKKVNFYTNKKILIIGSGIDLETGKALDIKTDYNKIKKEAAYTVGTGKDEYFLVTDPECPYCQMLDRKLHLLKKDVKIYVFLNPYLINSHIGAEGITNYILSQPKSKREAIASKLIQSNDKAYVLKTVDDYNISMYKKLLVHIDNKRLVNSYTTALSKAFNVKLDTKEQIIKFCKEKISKITRLNHKDTTIKKMTKIMNLNFNVRGTPSLFDMNGKAIQDYFYPFYKNNIVDFKEVETFAKNGMTVKLSDGKRKGYLFINTQDKNSLEIFNNEKEMKSMKKDTELHVILVGVPNTKGGKEGKYILSFKDMKKRKVLLEALMKGKELSFEELNKSYEQNLNQKIDYFMSRKIRGTLVNKTPMFIRK